MELDLFRIIIFFIIGWSAYFGYLHPRNLGYVNSPLINILWYIFTLICGVMIFGDYPNLFSIHAVLLFTLIILIYLSVTYFWRIGELEEFHRNYLIVKLFEIGFQQFLIVSLISWFGYYLSPGIMNLFSFCVLFGTLHIGLLFFKPLGNIRYLYFLLSFVGGIMFYLLITVGVFGVELAFLLHYMFYVFMSYNIDSKTLKSL